MWIIICEQGCFPYLHLEVKEDGTALTFGSEAEGEAWVKENCAWGYKVIQW